MAALTENGEGKKEISMFFVRADAEGVKAGGHEDKMGIRTSDTCDVIFENVLVPERNRIGMEGQGFETAMKALDEARAFMGCVAVGIAQRALEGGSCLYSHQEAIWKTSEQKPGDAV